MEPLGLVLQICADSNPVLHQVQASIASIPSLQPRSSHSSHIILSVMLCCTLETANKRDFSDKMTPSVQSTTTKLPRHALELTRPVKTDLTSSPTTLRHGRQGFLAPTKSSIAKTANSTQPSAPQHPRPTNITQLDSRRTSQTQPSRIAVRVPAARSRLQKKSIPPPPPPPPPAFAATESRPRIRADIHLRIEQANTQRPLAMQTISVVSFMSLCGMSQH